MRVLHVTPSFYPAWAYGGVTRCAYEVCRALVRRGVEVTVWTTDVLDATQRLRDCPADVDGIRVQHFPNLSNRLAYHLQLYLPRGLRAYARRHVGDFDVVHLHAHRHALNLWVARAAWRAGVPYVLTGHGTVPVIERRLLVKRCVDALGARAVLTHAARCIAVSGAEVTHFRAAGVDTQRVCIIPNGIRAEEFATKPPRGAFRRAYGLGGGPLVLFLGKITPRKGVDVLIRALAQLPAEVQLVVAGNFMMPAEPLHDLVRRQGVQGRVHFVGLLSGDQKRAAYVDADVVAYPSLHEIFGLVPFEALVCGTPVVVCDDSGCGEVVQAAGGGLLTHYGDASGLAAALDTLLGDPALRAHCVASGRRYVENHLGWDLIAAQTLRLYEDVVGARAETLAPRARAAASENAHASGHFAPGVRSA